MEKKDSIRDPTAPALKQHEQCTAEVGRYLQVLPYTQEAICEALACHLSALVQLTGRQARQIRERVRRALNVPSDA